MIQPLGQFLSLRASPLGAPDLEPAVKPPVSSETGPLGGAHKFGSLFTDLVGEVDGVRQHAAAEAQKVMLGQGGELHTAVISLQESSVALSLMVEVRNKLVESYQELMRMPV